METKICKKCGEVKEVEMFKTEFYKKRNGEISILSRRLCKICYVIVKRDRSKQYLENNKNKIIKTRKEDREKNPEKYTKMNDICRERYVERYLTKKIEYRKKEKNKISENKKRYWKKNKEILVSKKKEYYLVNRDKIINEANQQYLNNSEKIKAKKRDNTKQLKDVYIAFSLKRQYGMNQKTIYLYPDLIEVKRLIIKTKRAITTQNK